jgi:hypothetical protein
MLSAEPISKGELSAVSAEARVRRVPAFPGKPCALLTFKIAIASLLLLTAIFIGPVAAQSAPIGEEAWQLEFGKEIFKSKAVGLTFGFTVPAFDGCKSK